MKKPQSAQKRQSSQKRGAKRNERRKKTEANKHMRNKIKQLTIKSQQNKFQNYLGSLMGNPETQSAQD